MSTPKTYNVPAYDNYILAKSAYDNAVARFGVGETSYPYKQKMDSFKMAYDVFMAQNPDFIFHQDLKRYSVYTALGLGGAIFLGLMFRIIFPKK